MSVELTDNVSNDFYWEGVTQHQIHLKYGEERRFSVRLLAVRAGVYNIANNIKYTIQVSKTSSYPVSHREYEHIFMTVRQPAPPPSAAFDFFEDIREGAFRKKEVAEEQVEQVEQPAAKEEQVELI